MIERRESGQIEIKFGIGDILVSSGHFQDGRGLVMLSNHEVQPIGTQSGKFIGESVEIFDMPEIQTVMTFTKTESIDVVIEQLENAKTEMENHKKETDCTK